MIYPRHALQTLALVAQGLHRTPPPDAAPKKDDLLAAIRQMGGLQIDALQRVNRAHYVTLWSRLGSYDASLLDRLLDDPADRHLYEYWFHAACLLPLDHFRFSLTNMARHAANPDAHARKLLDTPEGETVMNMVRDKLAASDGVTVADFDDQRPAGSWWSWKPSKHALEYLYDCGEVMVAARRGFRRVYDLRERVLPAWVDVAQPTDAAALRYRLTCGARGFGVCDPGTLPNYTHMRKTPAKPIIEAMLADGTLQPIRAETLAGEREWVIFSDYLPLMQRILDGEITAEQTTVLTPFDNLFWSPNRDELLWGFEQKLEAYVPAPKRRWGYFCLPILHRGQLIGRLDPKLDRKKGVLHIEALHLEEGVALDERLLDDVAAMLKAFVAWHRGDDIVIEKSNPPAFGHELAKRL